MSICSTNDIGFISTKLFSFSNPILKFVAEIHQKKMLKMHAAVWHYFWVPLPYNKPCNWCNKRSRSHG